jgi:RNA polymerase sigma-70 factor (ECF subfamily)
MPTVTLRSMTCGPLNQEFDELFRQHHQLIYRTALGVTGSSEDAEDVLQTIFLRLLGREFPPDLNKNPRGYLYRAAVNVSLSVIRNRSRNLQLLDPDNLTAVVCGDESERDKEVRNQLIQAISQLNRGAIEVLMLRYVHNYSYAEIAKVLGTSQSVIAVSLYRSRARIRKLMRASGENG